MSTGADQVAAVDVQWMDRRGCIAAWRIRDNLIDCGPTTTLPHLLRALDGWRPKRLILTHIHFDHAGAAGALAQEWPELEVYVHRRGARHMASPERLEARVIAAEPALFVGTLQRIVRGELALTA